MSERIVIEDVEKFVVKNILMAELERASYLLNHNAENVSDSFDEKGLGFRSELLPLLKMIRKHSLVFEKIVRQQESRWK